MSFLRHFADGRLQSELSAQKATNLKLHKALKRERNRANEYAQRTRSRKRQVVKLRKQVRDLEVDNETLRRYPGLIVHGNRGNQPEAASFIEAMRIRRDAQRSR